MGTVQDTISEFIKEATGKTDVASIDFRPIDEYEKEKINFRRVRGNIRMMLGRFKTSKDVEAIRKAFFALKIP